MVMDEEIAKPVACTLTTKEAAEQTIEWVHLSERAEHVAMIDRGVRMVFPATMVDGVESLAERERACCAFLEITTSLTGDRLTLDITSADQEGRAVISKIAGLAIQ